MQLDLVRGKVVDDEFFPILSPFLFSMEAYYLPHFLFLNFLKFSFLSFFFVHVFLCFLSQLCPNSFFFMSCSHDLHELSPNGGGTITILHSFCYTTCEID